jgi:hypothetical protein
MTAKTVPLALTAALDSEPSTLRTAVIHQLLERRSFPDPASSGRPLPPWMVRLVGPHHPARKNLGPDDRGCDPGCALRDRLMVQDFIRLGLGTQRGRGGKAQRDTGSGADSPTAPRPGCPVHGEFLKETVGIPRLFQAVSPRPRHPDLGGSRSRLDICSYLLFACGSFSVSLSSADCICCTQPAVSPSSVFSV